MKPAYSLMLLLLIPSAVVGMEQDSSNNNSKSVDSPSSVRRVTRVVSRSDSQIPHGASSPLGTSPRSSSYSMMPGVLSRTSSSGVAAVARTSSSDFFLRNPEKKLQLVVAFLPNTTNELCKKLNEVVADENNSASDKVLSIRTIMQAEDKPVVEWIQKVIDICKDNPLSTSQRFDDLPPAHEIAGSPRSRSGSIVVRSRGSSNADQQVDQK